jgi:tetratricopeptide (TPR) repeat protein
MSNQTEQFKAGVSALRGGDRETAARILREVVAADPTHEQAWLWLSGAVPTAEERRQCLQQALALNPSNEAVRRSLNELEPTRPPSPPPKPPANPAPIPTTFDDVWVDEEYLQLCPYCAAVLAAEHRHCPACGKKLILRFYRYDNTSTNFHVYWVLVLALGQLALLQLGFDLVMGASLPTLIQHGIFVPLSFGLTFFVMRRHFWAYIGSLLMLFSAGLLLLAAPLLGENVAELLLGEVAARTPLVGLGQGAVAFINGAVRILQLANVALGLVYGVFLVAPDFAQDELRMTAAAPETQTAETAFLAGGRYAKQGMWASAVLNWRRAHALAPTRLLYSLSLSQAYRELGFYERSLHVLQSASQMATTHEGRTKIEEETIKTQAKMSAGKV